MKNQLMNGASLDSNPLINMSVGEVSSSQTISFRR